MSAAISDMAILLLIAAPALSGLACLLLGRLAWIGKVVILTAAVLISSISYLMYEVVTGGAIAVDHESLPSVSTLMTFLDLALLVSFAYIAWRGRSLLAGMFVAVQAIVLFVVEMGLEHQGGAALVVDQLSVLIAFITSVIGSIICLYAVRYMEHYQEHGRFFAVMLLFLGAMNGAVFANDLLWLFLFWEATTLCSFLLIGHTGTKEAKASALTAAVYTLGGGSALILGIALCWHYYGTTLLDRIPEGGAIGGLALLPLALLAVAAFTKSAQLPFQKWLLGAMVAPTPVSALLHSATMVNLGVYLLLRLAPNLSGTGYLIGLVGLAGATTFLVTAVLAITQSNAKRVLAYSTIGNLGLIVACVGLDTSMALVAGLLLVLFHATSKALLFMSVGVVKEEVGSENIDAMEGLRDSMPGVAVSIFLGIFMMILPPFGMFASKWMLGEAVASSPLVAVLLVAGFGATVVYYAKWLGHLFTGGPGRKAVERGPTDLWYLGALGSTAVIGAVATALIGPILDALVNPYVSTVFDAQVSAGTLGLESPVGLLPLSLLLLLAIGAALLMLLPRKAGKGAEVYTCGEGSEVRTGTYYFWPESRVVALTHRANLAAVVLLLALIMMPVLGEVI
ncbi:MAG: proton-conducting transporter membrane subunit [Methanomassiliicoccus sp.]|nr:proton-conducting transporter membrane subunit [Methanomassiliicoccus sp.]